MFNFSKALDALKAGNMVARIVKMQKPDENSKMRQPYIFISPKFGGFVPWVASQADLLAEDWVIVDLNESQNDEYKLLKLLA